MKFGLRENKCDKANLPMFPSTSSSGSSLGILGDLLTCKYDEMKQQDYENMTHNTISVIKDSYDSFISDSTKRVSSSLFSMKKNSNPKKYKQKKLPISVEEIQCINYNNMINGNIRQSRIPTISSIGDISPLFRQDTAGDTDPNKPDEFPMDSQDSHTYGSRKCSDEQNIAYQRKCALSGTNITQDKHSTLIEPKIREIERTYEKQSQTPLLKNNVTHLQDISNSSPVNNAYTYLISSPTEYTLLTSTNNQNTLVQEKDDNSYRNLNVTNSQQNLTRAETVSTSSLINCYLELEPQDLQTSGEQQIELNNCREMYKDLQDENEKLRKQNIQLASQLKSMSMDVLQSLDDRKQGLTNSKLIFDTINLKKQLAAVTEELLELKTIVESQMHNI